MPSYNTYGTSQIYTSAISLQNISYGTGAAFDVGTNATILNGMSALEEYSQGERQNNPGQLSYDGTDPWAIGFANGLAVYAMPEDGIASLIYLFDSYTNDQQTVAIDLIASFLQSDRTDNAVISFMRFVQFLTGIGPDDYVQLTDPRTRVAWVSAVINYIQDRIIYDYEQVINGCAESLNIDPVEFARYVQNGTAPWLNSVNSGGFVSPTLSQINLSGSSTLELIGSVLSSSGVQNIISGLFSKNSGTQNQSTGGGYGFADEGSIISTATNTTSSSFINVTPSADSAFAATVSASSPTASPYNPYFGSPAYIADPSPLASVGRQNISTYESGGIGSDALISTYPSSVGRQDTSIPNYDYNSPSGIGSDALISTYPSSIGRQDMPIPDYGYTPPVGIRSDSLYPIQTPSYGRQDMPIDSAYSRDQYQMISPPDQFAGGTTTSPTDSSFIPFDSSGINSPLAINQLSTSSGPISTPYTNPGDLAGGGIAQSAPSQNLVTTYDPLTGQTRVVNGPITGQTPAPGQGGAATHGGQGTPQGAAATGQPAGGC